MNREQEYKIALLHVIKFIRGDGGTDMFKPLNAKYANDIADMCQYVLDGNSTEEAVRLIN
jgi:predicted ArsR family transcriptional regulator